MKLLGTLEGHSDSVNSAAFCPDGSVIITASADKTAKIWDTSNFELLATLEGHSGAVNSASFSPDDRLIVTASSDGTVKVWDAFTFECIKTIPNIPGLILVGVDLTKLDPRVQFTDKEKELLRTYGAKI